MPDNQSSVIKIVQELLLADAAVQSIDAESIAKKIELVLTMNPIWGVDLNRDAVTDELIRRFSIWVGDDISLKSEDDHQPWLDADRKEGWRYWQRYREFVEQNLSWDIAEKLDRSTDRIIGLLEDPTRAGEWSRRGLVVGHVQSGKTSNYTGLVCKAADAQYKIIIVLAGLHNNLRSQTQIRLEEGFLGYQTNTAVDILKLTGVGLIDSDMTIKPNCNTTRSDRGDFTGRAATAMSITPEQRPWLFVVKKNKTVLVRLLNWIQNHVADLAMAETQSLGSVDEDGLPNVKKRVTTLPILIIDDEADNASVDTGENVVDDQGRPNEEHKPKTINTLIRRILHSFARSAYVGYTATPFANIFIHEKGTTKAEGPDLFPSAFIQNLAAPNNYIGPKTVFGSPSTEGRVGGLPLVKPVDDFAGEGGLTGWMPVKHRNGHIPIWSNGEKLPPTLREAIDCFLLACAVRRFRGQSAKHASMLIHVSRFTSVQRCVRDDVDSYVSTLRQRLLRQIEHEEILNRLKELWHKDFLPATNAVRSARIGDIPDADPTWADLEAAVPEVLMETETRMINGTAKDALDYEESRHNGLKVIAVGGDKLARGLTLEGLCTSYFLRASRMYDTLMQMGRWFGYRHGYLDLCRLYTSKELINWFEHISDAADELREEFDLMANSGATPRDFGLKVQCHPDLMVTSQLKMRSARTLLLSYSGHLMQTVTFSEKNLQANIVAAKRFCDRLGRPGETGRIQRTFGSFNKSWAGHLWDNVSHQLVVDFLEEYQTSVAASRVNSKVLAEFIRIMAREGELTSWTVALLGIKSGKAINLAQGISINCVQRAFDWTDVDKFSIGVLSDPDDEYLVMSQEQWITALEESVKLWEKIEDRTDEQPTVPRAAIARRIRGLGTEGLAGTPEVGLICLYVLAPPREDMPEVAAFSVSFPGSKSDVKVEYEVNNVGWERDYGPSE